MDKIKIFIADDHAILREGLTSLLLQEPDLTVVGEADNGRDALRQMTAGGWDVAILDITMPELEGLEVLKRVRLIHPALPILILTAYDDESVAHRFLKAGASGYLTKASVTREVVRAIHQVRRGQRYLSPDMAMKLAERVMVHTHLSPHEALSDREYTIFCLMAEGKTTGQIAEMLKLSVSTVSTHRKHLLTKMNLANNTELVQYAVKNGLVK